MTYFSYHSFIDGSDFMRNYPMHSKIRHFLMDVALITTVAYLSIRIATWASSHLCDGIDNEVPSCTVGLWMCGLLAKKDRFEVLKQCFCSVRIKFIMWNLLISLLRTPSHHSFSTTTPYFPSMAWFLREEQHFHNHL